LRQNGWPDKWNFGPVSSRDVCDLVIVGRNDTTINFRAELRQPNRVNDQGQSRQLPNIFAWQTL
jgi:hypothetical protein